MRLNGGALILADESTGVVEYYGVDSADGISITNNANGGGIGINPASPSDTVYIHGDLSVSGSSSFTDMTFQNATFTNAFFQTNTPPAYGTNAFAVWNSNGVPYYVNYDNAGLPVSTNAFGSGVVGSSTTSTISQ